MESFQNTFDLSIYCERDQRKQFQYQKSARNFLTRQTSKTYYRMPMQYGYSEMMVSLKQKCLFHSMQSHILFMFW